MKDSSKKATAKIKKSSNTSFKLATLPGVTIRAIKYIIIFFILIFILFSALLINYSVTSIGKGNVNVVVNVPTGSSFLKVTEILNEAGLVKSRSLFYTLAIIKRATRIIRAGEYEFNTSLTPLAVIDKLVRGEIKFYVVTIPEDFSAKDIAERLEFYKLVDQETFFELARDKYFLISLGINADSIEGYLFPETYLFNRSMSTRQIMKIMVSQFWKKVTPEMVDKAKKLGFNTHQFITFASIVGKESGYDGEKPLIAAVFYNRLKKNMRLQSDPTAVYDLENFEGKVLRKHLQRNSPYNTYIIKGLPPGPIGNPGMTSLNAVLNPAPVKYLYFVSKFDGTHFFSESLQLHNEAIKQSRRLKSGKNK
jgi:peptidoglycan lytic transglycosylase G